MTANTISNGTAEKPRTRAPQLERSFRSVITPRTNIRNTEGSVILEIALPGVSKEDVEVSVKSRLLTVSVNAADTSGETQTKYLRREIPSRFGDVKYKLGENLNVEEMSAAMQNGVLALTIPRYNPEDLKKKIEIQ